MNQYLKNLSAVLEVLIMKSQAQDVALRYVEHDEISEYDIFDHDVVDSGLTLPAFASSIHTLEKQGYIKLEGVKLKESEDSTIDREEDTITKLMYQGLVMKPGVRFRVWVNGNIWRLYELILKDEDLDKINVGTTAYSSEEYALMVYGHKIVIKLKNEPPMGHYILSHMMKGGFGEQYFYSEMIKQNLLGDDQPWRSYYDACKNINASVEKLTKGKVKDLLIASTGEAGYVRLNPMYL